MIVYITKFALTKGIIEFEGNESEYSIGSIKEGFGHLTYLKSDYKYTKEEAIVKAEEMRTRKIRALKKQFDKLIKLKF